MFVPLNHSICQYATCMASCFLVTNMLQVWHSWSTCPSHIAASSSSCSWPTDPFEWARSGSRSGSRADVDPDASCQRRNESSLCRTSANQLNPRSLRKWRNQHTSHVIDTYVVMGNLSINAKDLTRSASRLCQSTFINIATFQQKFDSPTYTISGA